MKKIISFTLILSMFFCNISTLAFASDVKDQTYKDQTYIINEYEILEKAYEDYKEILSNNDIHLLNTNNIINNSTEENKEDSANNYQNFIKGLESLENYKEEYINKIYNLQNYTIEELKAIGYDEDQIDAIKNFDGSHEMLMRAATQVSVEVGIRNLNQSYNGTTLDIIADFNCKGIQSNWFNDIFAVVWSQPLTYVSGKGYVEYRDTYGTTSSSTTIRHTPESSSLYGRQITFPKNKHIDNKSKYVFAGSMILNLKSNTMVYDIATLAQYGYNSFNPVPGVSFPGALSISFDNGIYVYGEDYDSNWFKIYKNKTSMYTLKI